MQEFFSNNVLGTLANFRSQCSTFVRYRTPPWQLVCSDGRTMFDGADYWRFVHAISVGHRRETLLAAHLIDHALLPSVEHGVRKNRKIAEHPQQINPLQE